MLKRIGTLHSALVLSAMPLAVFLTGPPRSILTFGFLIGVWALVLIGVVLPRDPLPHSTFGRLALAGMVLLALLFSLSITWAGVKAPAVAAAVTSAIYAGYLLAAVPALRRRRFARSVEPFALLTLVCAAGYGLSERIAPRAIHLETPEIALGRLTEPLGYWNAVGLAAGIGIMLAASVAADTERRRATSVLAMASIPLVASALWLSYSRGALASTVAGLVALVAFRRTRAQAVTAGIAVLGTAAAALTVERLDSIKITTGSLRNRSHDGDLFAVFLLAATITFALIGFAVSRSSLLRRLSHEIPRPIVKALGIVAVLLALGPLALVLTNTPQSQRQPTGTNAARLTTADSDRSKYWKVQLDRFVDAPIAGHGGGSFAAAWMQHRGTLRTAKNAHSLPIEVAGDLGILGLTALLMLILGLAGCARRSVRADRRCAAGPAAALVIFGSHCLIDWDWQIPGLMAVVLAMAGVVIATIDTDQTREGAFPRFLLAAASVALIAWGGWITVGIKHEREARSVMRAASMLGWNSDRWNRVEKDLNRATELDPEPAARVWLTIAAVQRRDLRLAEAVASDLVDENPGSWFAWKLYAAVLERTAPERAAAANARFHELRPTPLR